MYVNHLHWITSWVPWYQWHSLQQTCPVINLIKNFKIRFLFLTFHQLRELKQSFLEFPCIQMSQMQIATDAVFCSSNWHAKIGFITQYITNLQCSFCAMSGQGPSSKTRI